MDEESFIFDVDVYLYIHVGMLYSIEKMDFKKM